MAAPGGCSPGMDVPDRVTELIPHLRRYARALGTSEISSDERELLRIAKIAYAQLEKY